MKDEIKPEYHSLNELISTMKEIVERAQLKRTPFRLTAVVEIWMREAARVVLAVERSPIYNEENEKNNNV